MRVASATRNVAESKREAPPGPTRPRRRRRRASRRSSRSRGARSRDAAAAGGLSGARPCRPRAMSFGPPRGLPDHYERSRLPLPAPRTAVLAVGGPLASADVPGLCARARSLLACGDVAYLVCDVGALERADLAAVDALARLQLTARRQGARVLLRRPSRALLSLLAFVGLDGPLGVQPQRQAELREHPLGVEEEREPDDPAA